MLFISIDDFFEKARNMIRLSREDERSFALKMQEGNADARQAIVNSYLPLVASYIENRAPKEIQTLKTVYCCIHSLEQGVDQFNFLQDSETFTHHMTWRLRQCITKCIAYR